MLIILKGDLSAVELNDFVSPRNSRNKWHLDFNERIFFLLFSFDTSGRVKNNNKSNNDIIKHFTFRKRKRKPEISNFFSNILFSSYP
jgi:hypothetical protein